MTSDPRAVAARFYDEVLNQKRQDVIGELVAKDFVEHGKPPVEGIDGLRQFVAMILNAFPDLEFRADDWVVEGDRVVARCFGRGTHRGEIFGFAPTGREVSWTALHLWRVADGKLAERWSEADLLGLTDQMSGDGR